MSDMKLVLAACMRAGASRPELAEAARALRAAGVSAPVWRSACESVGRFDSSAAFVASLLPAV